MKKITAIVSSLILSASLLVGCGASSAPAPTTAPATTPLMERVASRVSLSL